MQKNHSKTLRSPKPHISKLQMLNPSPSSATTLDANLSITMSLNPLIHCNSKIPKPAKNPQIPEPQNPHVPSISNRHTKPPPLRCNLGVYPLARRTGTQTHRSLLFLQAHGCSQYSARTLSNRHRYMQVIRETVRAPGCVTSVFQPGTNLKTRRTA